MRRLGRGGYPCPWDRLRRGRGAPNKSYDGSARSRSYARPVAQPTAQTTPQPVVAQPDALPNSCQLNSPTQPDTEPDAAQPADIQPDDGQPDAQLNAQPVAEPLDVADAQLAALQLELEDRARPKRCLVVPVAFDLFFRSGAETLAGSASSA